MLDLRVGKWKAREPLYSTACNNLPWFYTGINHVQLKRLVNFTKGHCCSILSLTFLECLTSDWYLFNHVLLVKLKQSSLLRLSLVITNAVFCFQYDAVSDTIVIETSQIEEPDAQVQDLTNAAEIGNLEQLEAQIQINEQRGISTEGIEGLEIIKSIVYGGLVESITSLGVVSSAAGSDSPTCKFLYLLCCTYVLDNLHTLIQSCQYIISVVWGVFKCLNVKSE